MNSGARTSISPVARGAALERTANGSQTSTGVDSDGADQIRTPLEDSVSEMVTAGPTTSGESGTISRGGPEAIRTEDREVPRPDPVDDPRWEAAIRARVARTPINRGDPGTEATVSLTNDRTNPTVARQDRATGLNSGNGLGSGAADGTNGTQAIVRLTNDRTTSTVARQDRATGLNSGDGLVSRAADRTNGTTQAALERPKGPMGLGQSLERPTGPLGGTVGPGQS